MESMTQRMSAPAVGANHLAIAVGLLMGGLLAVASATLKGHTLGEFAFVVSTGMFIALFGATVVAGYFATQPTRLKYEGAFVLWIKRILSAGILLACAITWLILGLGLLARAICHFRESAYGDPWFVNTILLFLLVICVLAFVWSVRLSYFVVRGRDFIAHTQAGKGIHLYYRAGVAVLVVGLVMVSGLRWPPRLWFLLAPDSVKAETDLGRESARMFARYPSGPGVEFQFTGVPGRLLEARRHVQNAARNSFSEILEYDGSSQWGIRFTYDLHWHRRRLETALDRWQEHRVIVDEAVRAGSVGRTSSSNCAKLVLSSFTVDRWPVTVTRCLGTDSSRWRWELEEVHGGLQGGLWDAWVWFPLSLHDPRIIRVAKVDDKHSIEMPEVKTQQDFRRRVEVWRREFPALSAIRPLNEVLHSAEQ